MASSLPRRCVNCKETFYSGVQNSEPIVCLACQKELSTRKTSGPARKPPVQPNNDRRTSFLGAYKYGMNSSASKQPNPPPVFQNHSVIAPPRASSHAPPE